MEQLKLKKRNLKKRKVKQDTSHIQAPENDQICSGNGYDLKDIEESKQSTTAEEAGKNLMLKRTKRREKVSQGVDCTTKKKRCVEMSQGDPDSSKKKKKKEKRVEDKLKKSTRKENKDASGANSVKNRCDAGAETVEEISLVDEDCSRGMKKWVLDYRRGRLGLDMVQQRLDEFMTAYEAEQEQARKEREAQGAEEGWTVVVHHKGRKKTTDSESGIAVGSVPQAAVEDKMAKKKQKELALDFYRFQKREAQRNEVMMLQSKFEQDKKRLQQLRAARKFRPY